MRNGLPALRVWGAWLALLAPLGACGGGGPATPSAPPAPTPAPTPTPLPYVGNWFGTTSQANPISFAVGQSGVTSLSLQYRVQGGGCTVTASSTITFTTPLPVNGSSFQVTSSGTSADLTVRGSFSSSTAAAGDFTATTKGAPCGGLTTTATWTANRP